MSLALSILLLFLSLSIASSQNETHSTLRSFKRGLIYIDWDTDDSIWSNPDSDLTWYYNYGAYPSDELDNTKMQFVPMMWGAGQQYAGFHDTVKSLIDGGLNIKYVLGFNEPDGCSGGGSCLNPKKAAETWRQEIEPLKHLGVKLGAPAVIGGDAAWLQQFYTHCAGGCTTDFLPVHYYDSADGLADWVGLMRATYPNVSTLWVTEFAQANASLAITQDFYNYSISFLDATPYVTHYSYFGSFRSDVSNIGPNAAMLNTAGKLTDIGAWYLGLSKLATGLLPKSDAVASVVPSDSCRFMAFAVTLLMLAWPV